jgi:hypothetical protein
MSRFSNNELCTIYKQQKIQKSSKDLVTNIRVWLRCMYTKMMLLWTHSGYSYIIESRGWRVSILHPPPPKKKYPCFSEWDKKQLGGYWKQEILDNISSQEIFLHRAGFFCKYWNFLKILECHILFVLFTKVFCKSRLSTTIDLSPYEWNLDQDMPGQKFHHSLKEHHKISNIQKFRCEIL